MDFNRIEVLHRQVLQAQAKLDKELGENKLPEAFDRSECLSAIASLNNNNYEDFRNHLKKSFTWSSTPQGKDFWQMVSNSPNTDISVKEKLQEWVILSFILGA